MRSLISRIELFFKKEYFITILHRSTHLLKKSLMPLAIVMIIMAIFFTVFRALTPWAKQYKGQVEQHLSTLVGQPVTINSMETSWYWFEPVLKLNQVSLLDNKDNALKLSKLLVGINIFSSILNWQIEPGILYIDDLHLTIRQVDNHWRVDGIKIDKELNGLESDSYLPVLSWLLEQQKIIIKNVSALVYLKNGTLLPLSSLNLTSENYNGHYRLKGGMKLAQTTPTEILIIADLNLNPKSIYKVSGHVYLSLKQFLPKQWQMFFPELPYHVDSGNGDIKLWLDIKKGNLTNLQTVIDLSHIEWGKKGDPDNQFIQSLKANLAWSPIKDGWQLSGDKIKLRAGGIIWPENSLLIKYQPLNNSYNIYTKALLLEPLLNSAIEWPEIMKPLLLAHPRGKLNETELSIKEGKLDHLLTRFEDLSFNGINKNPAISNISGVLNWQPTGGRLDLNSENITIAPYNLLPLNFMKINASLEWEGLNHDFQVKMDHLLLTDKNLLVSAKGEIKDPLDPNLAKLNLQAEFAAENLTQWFSYIPEFKGKEKLNHWLKHDIKRIDKASGQININGPWVDFPFDKSKGDFLIESQVNGAKLYFNRKWPFIDNLDIYIKVNKRTLEAEMLHGSFNGVDSTQANLKVDDLGLDKETLLIHGKVDGPAEKLKAYIFASPLKKSLLKLKHFEIKGNVGLDLNLDVPLYPGNDEVFARGDINFVDNEMVLPPALNNLKIKKITGALNFDEDGISNSDLKATLLGNPLDMNFSSINKPRRATKVSLKGSTTINSLNKKFKSPIFSLMDGSLNFKSELTLTADLSQNDIIELKSNLKGVSIDVPKPFAKTADSRAPLTVKIGLNANNGTKLFINYDNKLSGDLEFKSKDGVSNLEKGEILIGSSNAKASKPGLNIIGTFALFDVDEWRNIGSKLNSNSTHSLITGSQFIDLKLDKIILWGKSYENLSIKAKKSDKDIWSFNIDQYNIAGDLSYKLSENRLSGHLLRLNIEKYNLKNTAEDNKLKPDDIPNLDLAIDNFKLKDVSIGEVKIKSTSKASNFHLESGQINSSDYQLVMSGDWKQIEGKDNTTIKADIAVKDFGKCLARLHITPVVNSKKGIVQFIGGGPFAINQFSFDKVNGTLYLEFQNGQITHLSKATEEKLGLGKLLSLLSLQTIPRRLKLDFSDLSSGGYSYDVFKGNFAIKNGVMSTYDSYIDGPVAYANMKGNLDLVKQTYDLRLHVSPHITASLPIVATIAGGPIAGMATLVASKIINQGMQQITGYTYKVTGPWLKPDLQQISINKKYKPSGH